MAGVVRACLAPLLVPHPSAVNLPALAVLLAFVIDPLGSYIVQGDGELRHPMASSVDPVGCPSRTEGGRELDPSIETITGAGRPLAGLKLLSEDRRWK